MWYTNDLIKSLSNIKNRAYDIKKKDNKEKFIYDFKEDGCHDFYIRINNKFYHIDYNTKIGSAEKVYRYLYDGNIPTYVFDITIKKDTVFSDIDKAYDFDFDYFEYYKKAIENLKGNVTENAIYWEIRKIINTDHIGSKEFMNLIMRDLKTSIESIKSRNKDYNVDTYNEDIDQDYFKCGKSMIAVTDEKTYYLCSLTTLVEISELEEFMNSGNEFKYICDKTDDIDTVVGDIYEFTKKNKLEFYSYTYYRNAEAFSYNFTEKKMLAKLRG